MQITGASGMGTNPSININKKLYEIRWHGRGGQGAITAAKIVAQAAFLEGYRGVTAAPSFGAERRGAPVSASTRISQEPVMVMSQVENPDVVVVLDQTLLRRDGVTSGLSKGGWLIVNSGLDPKELITEGQFNIATADATKVCQELGLVVSGLIVVNTAILGAFIRATKTVSMPSIQEVIRGRFPKEAIEINLAVIARTYEITKVEELRK
jgi:2-oxoacid:acceptor oxidoreductase gamma subunit (pyruvate/2-ketoisovalerate family)